jgi:hypothetical protein
MAIITAVIVSADAGALGGALPISRTSRGRGSRGQVSFFLEAAPPTCDKQRMVRMTFSIGLGLLLAACANSPSYPNESACNSTPFKYGETGVCGYYPGYGWAHVPVFTTIRQN